MTRGQSALVRKLNRVLEKGVLTLRTHHNEEVEIECIQEFEGEYELVDVHGNDHPLLWGVKVEQAGQSSTEACLIRHCDYGSGRTSTTIKFGMFSKARYVDVTPEMFNGANPNPQVENLLSSLESSWGAK